MIVVTRLNDSQFAVNPDLIERIHANPDTTLVMVDGAKFIVTETMNEVIQLISNYRANIIHLARMLPDTGYARGAQQLGLVPPPEGVGSGAVSDGKADTTDNTVPLRPRNT